MPRPSDKMEGHVASWLKHMAEPERAERRARERPFVTISRECGAYGTTIAEKLVEHLRERERRRSAAWAVLDKELVHKVIEEHRLPAIFERYFAQASRSRLQDALDDLFGVHPPQETLVRKMSETILHLASLGYVILIDQGAGVISRTLPGGTHVRLIGSLEKRVAHMMEYLNVPEKQAREYVTHEDRDRHDYIKRYFKADIGDPSVYDLVINTDTVPLEKIVAVIGDMVCLPKADAS
jgi:hypothetical protein